MPSSTRCGASLCIPLLSRGGGGALGRRGFVCVVVMTGRGCNMRSLGAALCRVGRRGFVCVVVMTGAGM